MPTPENDPAVGDFVIVHGQIKSITDSIALVEVYRGYPVGANVAVQCGALDLAEVSGGATVAAETEQGRTGHKITIHECTLHKNGSKWFWACTCNGHSQCWDSKETAKAMGEVHASHVTTQGQ